ncbi:hypothetical protein PANT_7d00077 [Moesziomyces antarcticus T-34]|uniref:Uncharacterized protein n=1 Tax=Pseudozyma antarctica (strain T-34) TaxID=1151754 RepID=M9LYW1_PSEA3|nr:hypothetical protein PANT_7d00077 [Moesziomyces antarcticus T-34]
MSVRSAKGMASASARLSRPLSTTSNAASLSKRLRSHWGSATTSNTASASPAQTESTSTSSPSGSSAPPSKPSTASASSAKAPPRKAAFRALRHASNSTRANAPRKFVASYDKGKAKEQGGTQSAADHSASMLKELNALDDLLDSLQSKAFSISQRLKAVDLSRSSSKDQVEEAWGPDRLAPPNAESTWSAGPAGSDASSKPSDKKVGEPTTRLVFGDSLLAESSLRWRDSKGKTVEGVMYSGPFADEIKRYTESITGCVTANNVPVDKVAPLREMEVAKLAHGLDRVLFNPGVYWLRDPRSGIYNFDPRIKDILDVDLFDYAALPPYITSSKDPELAKLTKQHAKKYCGSTSSMTSLLSQCYFLISGWRNPDTSGFSAPFAGLPSGFSVGAKLPASILLNYKDGFYAIDADKASAGEAENNNYVLTSLGKSMEKMLTATPDEYAKYQRINSWKLSEEERTKPEAYHYACTGNMMMRSQLDCHDERLPHKTFDLKTRASIGIRNDRANYVEGSGYQIRRAQGLLESFEREYFDMVRAAFLKYNFQVRIGHMDGIFVAYHTTSTIFGFQYISVDEMNERLFGSQDMADQAFKLSLGMMEAVLDAATSMFPEQTLKITIEAKDKSDTGMVVYVEPTDQATATESNAANQASAEDGAKAGGGGRSIVQLDITVDRYLDGGLVLGPVDFSFLPGRRIDPMNEDEIERRLRQSLPPVRWEVDYRISPRSDLTEAKIRANLQAVRDRQASLGSLILPNVEALNEREQFRTTELAKNPEALKRFLEERASGVAAGMPLAPGQRSAEAASNEAVPQDALVAADKSPRRKQAETRFIRMRNIRTLRLRELAKLGAKDAVHQKSTDKHILYQPQS